MDNMVNNVICIIQNRMTSTRLPGKALLPLGKGGKTITEHIYERLTLSECINRVIFAIPDTPENDILFDFLTQRNIPVFRGSENDVLSRFYHCLQANPADIVIRATCDNPLVDWHHIKSMINILKEQHCDYVSSKGFSLGTGVEACTAEALKKAYQEATTPAEHEHVMPYLYLHPDVFKLGVYENCNKSQNIYRLTVDCKEDYTLMMKIYDELYDGNAIPTDKAIAYLDSHPDIAKLNENIQQKKI